MNMRAALQDIELQQKRENLSMAIFSKHKDITDKK